MTKIRIPKDFPVRPLRKGQAAKDRVTCGTCGLSWDDAKATSYTPAPSARCPFEAFHAEQAEPAPAARPLRADEVTFTVTAEQEDIQVKGNAMVSGDDAADRACEDEIYRQLDGGNVWAWAHVVVTATWQGFKGTASLGCCSYRSEAEFTEPGGYFDDLKSEALEDLNNGIAKVATEIGPLMKAREGGAR